jgi:prepilin-type N-terminal cleavage/methylation domain-containing protein
MDREIMLNKKGFTLIEVIMVTVLIGIMVAIAVPFYSRWKIKYSIENDVKIILSFLQENRAKAFAEKTSYTVQFPGSVGTSDTLQLLEGAVVKDTLKLKNKFKFVGSAPYKIIITKRGVFDGKNIYALNFDYNPEYSCITVSKLRVRLGVWNSTGSVCNAK